jgi:hypothetical protein
MGASVAAAAVYADARATAANNRWSMDFVADIFGASWRLRMLAINGDCRCESRGLLGDTSISAPGVLREFSTLVRRRRCSQATVIQGMSSPTLLGG